MTDLQLNHVLVLTTDLAESARFWTETIGLQSGYRPPFDFPGAWYYAGNVPVIHLALRDDVAGTGVIDHLALLCDADEYETMLGRLRHAEWQHRAEIVPETGARQIFVTGPDKLKVELQFPPAG